MANRYTTTIGSREYIGDSLSAINTNFDTLQTIACTLSSFLKGVVKFGVNEVKAGPGINATTQFAIATVSKEDCPRWFINENKTALLGLSSPTSFAVVMSSDFLKHIQNVADFNVTLKNMSTFVTFTTSNFEFSTELFRGGVRMLDGRVFIPRFCAADSYIFDYKKNITQIVGGTNTINGTGAPAVSAFWGGVLMSNGKVFLIPYNSREAVVHSTNLITSNKNTKYLWPEAVDGAFIGGTLLKNGNVLLSPYNMTKYGVFNPRTNTASNSAMPVGYVAKDIYGCCLTPNGKVLFIPYNTTKFWVLNNSTISSLAPTVSAPGNGAFRGGVLLKSGEVFCVPYNSDKAAIYNPITDTVRYTSSVFPGVKAFEGGTLLPDGRVFLCPAEAPAPVIFDTISETFETMNFSMSKDDYYGSILIDNNRVLMLPKNATSGAIFSIPCTVSFQTTVLSSPFINKL